MSAFAALVLLGVASSCKDQNFDWDNVHSLSYTQKFTDTFIKEFGQPAPGHQWGFDFNWENGGATRAVANPEGTMYVIKPDTDTDGQQRIYEWGGCPPDITDRESKEVYEWFRTHQVTWTNTSKIVGDCRAPYRNESYIGHYYIIEGKEYNGTQEYYDSELDIRYNIPVYGADISVNTNNLFDKSDFENKLGLKTVKGTLKDYDKDNNLISETTGLFYFEQNGNEQSGEITFMPYFDGIHTTRDTGLSAKCMYVIPDSDYSLDNPGNMGSSYNTLNTAIAVATRVNFTNAWIQHVASERFSTDSWDVSSSLKNADGTNFGFDENTLSGQSSDYCAKNMDFLQVYAINGTTGHNFDFNSATGYGYGKNENKGTYNGIDIKQNGSLVIGGNFNNLSYSCSIDALPHDKWIIVYLKGDGYEGWYLGFDFEGYGRYSNQQVAANGYCNDWIVKLTEVSLEDKWENYRLMCEDLGGDANKVTIGEVVHISDIDYNDIVLDVDRNADKTEVKLDLRAAGGTIPLTVWYGNQPLFETHEMFNQSNKKTWLHSSHKMTATDYAVMYNTQGGAEANTTDGVTPNTITLKFGQGVESPTLESQDGYTILMPSARFEESKLQFKVWRFETQEYINAPNHSYNDAEWVSIYNMEGDAPLKLCVPTEVRWLKERRSIKDGYPGFANWVKDPYDFFWGEGKTIVQDKLCPNVVTPASGN